VLLCIYCGQLVYLRLVGAWQAGATRGVGGGSCRRNLPTAAIAQSQSQDHEIVTSLTGGASFSISRKRPFCLQPSISPWSKVLLPRASWMWIANTSRSCLRVGMALAGRPKTDPDGPERTANSGVTRATAATAAKRT